MIGATGKAKADALRLMADLLLSRKEFLQAENAKDLAPARQAGLAAPLLDRLALSDNALHTMAAGLRQIADMPDPIGGMTASVIRPNGLPVAPMRVPRGAPGFIYESRPNVRLDAIPGARSAGHA